jgi:hypothetical protein
MVNLPLILSKSRESSNPKGGRGGPDDVVPAKALEELALEHLVYGEPVHCQDFVAWPHALPLKNKSDAIKYVLSSKNSLSGPGGRPAARPISTGVSQK